MKSLKYTLWDQGPQTSELVEGDVYISFEAHMIRIRNITLLFAFTKASRNLLRI